MAKSINILILSSLLVACDMMDYHPYDTHIDGPKEINARSIALIEQATQQRDSIKFAVISDTQRWYDHTHHIVNHINGQADIDFVVHCGDLTDFGMTQEFEWMRDELLKLNMPYIATIGNHDCLGTGRDAYRAMYGDYNFSFNAGNTHFLVLNTNSLEFRKTNDAPNLDFMARNAASIPDSIEQTVVVMHAAPLSDQFDDALVDRYCEALAAYPNVRFGLCGHEHRPAVRFPYPDCPPYYLVGSAKTQMYYVFTLHKDGNYDYEEIWL